jgi:DNA-binding transcriptional LysR family regulator
MFVPFKNEIKAFMTLADFKSVSKAALSLGMSQPQLSKILSNLEVAINSPLFERTNRGLVITATGLKLYKNLNQLQEFWADISPESEVLPSIFRIGAHALIAKEFIPVIVQGLLKSFPAISLNYVEASSKQMSHLILDRKIELGIAVNPLPLQGLIIHEVKKDIIGLYQSGKNHDLLVINPQSVMYSRLLKKVKYKRIIEIENYEIASKIALENGCDVLLPSPAVENQNFKLIKTLEKVSVCLVYREEMRGHGAIKSVRQIVSAWGENLNQ